MTVTKRLGDHARACAWVVGWMDARMNACMHVSSQVPYLWHLLNISNTINNNYKQIIVVWGICSLYVVHIIGE